MVTICAAIAVCVAAIAQSGQEPSVKTPHKGDDYVMTACIQGSTAEQVGTGLTFRLTGDKKLLKELAKQHVGHVEDLVGVLKSDLIQPAGRSKTVGKGGKTTIFITAGESRSATQVYEPLPVMAVTSYEHTSVVCSR
jgi:hypothetical protein